MQRTCPQASLTEVVSLALLDANACDVIALSPNACPHSMHRAPALFAHGPMSYWSPVFGHKTLKRAPAHAHPFRVEGNRR